MGGRSSSVFDVSMKNGNRRDYHLQAGISPIAGRLAVEGPIIRDRLSFALAGRSTYSNWLLRLIDDPVLNQSSASFYDLSGKVSYLSKKSGELSLAFYQSGDEFKLASDTTFSYLNQTLSLNYKHLISKKWSVNTGLNHAFYDYSVSSPENGLDGYRLAYNISTQGAYAALHHYPDGATEMSLGAETRYYRVNPGSIRPFGPTSIRVPETLQEEYAFENALHGEVQRSLGQR
ncbi:MAG: hypothetical protein HC842_06720, partial [Cytophagales bacterium]|nr:hypothetical protein [Cytophagales bacterium]